MNLYSDPPLELIQTPTWITYLILSHDEKGKPDGGPNAVMKRYLLWLEYEHQQLFNRGYVEAAKVYREHIDSLKDKDYSDYEFYAL